MPAAPSIAERIKAARGASKDYRDVDVVIDQDVADQVEDLDRQIQTKETEVTALEEEKERLRTEMRFSDPRGREIDERIVPIQEEIGTLEEQRDAIRAGTLLRLRFDKMPGEEWAAIASRHPGRLDSSIDRLSGYNYHAAAVEAAPLCGYALGDDDAREPLTAEDWAGLFEILSGRELEAIATSLWEMNDWGPRRKINAAKKASTDASGSRSS